MIFGFEAKLLIGEAGSTGTTEIAEVKNLSVNMSAGEFEASTRKGGGWKSYEVALKDAQLEFDIPYEPQDAQYKKLQEAFLNRKKISLFVTDGNGVGLDADWVVSGFNIGQQLEEGVGVAVSCKPNTKLRAPAWKEGSAA